MYDAYDWVFEAERDLEGIENEVPALPDDPQLLPFGIVPERRRARPARTTPGDRTGAREQKKTESA